jgi:hypothetical protein
VIQWDGFVIDASRWKEEFMHYDYIGSPWIIGNSHKNCIGNGGFSLRSKKFLEISSSLEYTPHECTWITQAQKDLLKISPEDWFMCFHKYDYMINMGIKFPDKKLAFKFAVEHPDQTKPYNRNKIETYKSFGFHGDFNQAAMELLK